MHFMMFVKDFFQSHVCIQSYCRNRSFTRKSYRYLVWGRGVVLGIGKNHIDVQFSGVCMTETVSLYVYLKFEVSKCVLP